MRAAAEVLAAGDVHILVNNSGGPAGGPITKRKKTPFSPVQPALDRQPKLGQSRPSGHATRRLGKDCQCHQHLGEGSARRIGCVQHDSRCRGQLGQDLGHRSRHSRHHGEQRVARRPHTARLTSLAGVKQRPRAPRLKRCWPVWPPKCLRGAWDNPRKSDMPSFLCSPAAGYISGINLPVDEVERLPLTYIRLRTSIHTSMNSEHHAAIRAFMDRVAERNPNEPEFLPAVEKWPRPSFHSWK